MKNYYMVSTNNVTGVIAASTINEARVIMIDRLVTKQIFSVNEIEHIEVQNLKDMQNPVLWIMDELTPKYLREDTKFNTHKSENKHIYYVVSANDLHVFVSASGAGEALDVVKQYAKIETIFSEKEIEDDENYFYIENIDDGCDLGSFVGFVYTSDNYHILDSARAIRKEQFDAIDDDIISGMRAVF